MNSLKRLLGKYDLRPDVGQAWENLLASERVKRDEYKRERKNYYFWRTYGQKEVDWVEESQGRITGYEFKWRKDKTTSPRGFLAGYPGSEVKLVNRDSLVEFVT